MRCMTIAGLLGVWLATPVQAQTMPPPFEDRTLIACADQAVATQLLAVFEDDSDVGNQLLGHLAERGVCERATFSGKLVADVYKSRPAGTVLEGHVFEVDVTHGDVLKGRRRTYVLLYIAYDNEV